MLVRELIQILTQLDREERIWAEWMTKEDAQLRIGSLLTDGEWEDIARNYTVATDDLDFFLEQQ
jgi:hypothetical protein